MSLRCIKYQEGSYNAGYVSTIIALDYFHKPHHRANHNPAPAAFQSDVSWKSPFPNIIAPCANAVRLQNHADFGSGVIVTNFLIGVQYGK